MLTRQEKQQFASGDTNLQKRILQRKLEDQITILKAASDINTLKGAQGAVRILEALISSFD